MNLTFDKTTTKYSTTKYVVCKSSRKANNHVIFNNGDEYWYKDGFLHREDGPAVIRNSGANYWYQSGKLHRLDGPAVTYATGITEWWVNGEHCETNEEFRSIANLTRKALTLLILKYGKIR